VPIRSSFARSLPWRSDALAGALRARGERLWRVAPYAATLVLAAATAAAATNWMLEFSSRRSLREPVQAVATGNPTALTRATDTSALASLFGVEPGTGAGNVKLLGVIAVGREGQGIALVSIDEKPARAVRVGGSLASGVTLVEVRSDRILVDRGGTLQEVRLPPKPSSGSQPGSASNTPRAAARPGSIMQLNRAPPNRVVPSSQRRPRARRGGRGE